MFFDKNVELFFPSWTRKAISFTIDDGNITLDRKFINIVKRAGILGSFNLFASGLKRFNMTAEELREFYNGYEITNHCNAHPKALDPDIEYIIVDEQTPENCEAANLVIKTDVEGLYLTKCSNGTKTCSIATAETYIRLVSECKTELEEIFGEGKHYGFRVALR